jgi:uncharacterized membrane protein
MSFREKTAWISLISMSVIYGFYLWSVGRSEGFKGPIHLGGLLKTVIALVVVQVALTIVAAALAPKEANAPCDERDKLIRLRATHVAYSALATSIAFACFFGALNPPIIFNTNALLLVLVVAEMSRSACQIVQYRRGA